MTSLFFYERRVYFNLVWKTSFRRQHQFDPFQNGIIKKDPVLFKNLEHHHDHHLDRHHNYQISHYLWHS